MALEHTGTDLIGTFDMTAGLWVPSATHISVTANGAFTGPSDGYNSYTVAKISTTASVNLNANNLTTSAVGYTATGWVKAGANSNASLQVEIGLLQSTFKLASASILSGPGTLATASSRIQLTGLSTTRWTLVTMDLGTLAAGTNADLLFYTGGVFSTTVGHDIILGPWIVAPTSQTPAWSWTALPLGHQLTRGVPSAGVVMDGDAAYLADTPPAELDLARGQTVVISLRREADADMTLWERDDDSDNWLRVLYDNATGEVHALGMIGGVDLSAEAPAGTLPLDTDTELAIVIPASGSAIIYADAVAVSSTTTSSYSSVGIGLGVMSRVDGTEGFQGVWFDGSFFDAALTAVQIKSLYLARVQGGVFFRHFLYTPTLQQGR